RGRATVQLVLPVGPTIPPQRDGIQGGVRDVELQTGRALTLSRRSFGVLAAASVLAACTRAPRTASPDAPLRVLAINHVWTQAISRYLPEIEERIGRRVSVRMLTADQLTSSFNVKLNASATDIDVMTVRPLQDQMMFARNGWVTDLADRGAAGRRPLPRCLLDVVPPVAGVATVSVPVVTERPALYYRKDLLEDVGGAPRTLDDMMHAALELERRDEGFFGFVGRGQRNGAVSQWSSFLYSFGGDFTVDGRSGIGTPEAIAAYEFYGRLLRDAGPPGATNMSLEQAMPIFAQGKAAMYVSSEEHTSELQSREN